MRRAKSMTIAAMLLCALALFGCRPLVEDPPQTLDIYATFYPIYALTEAVTRDVPDVNVHCLAQPQDGCLRDYALSDWDLYLLASSADAVIAGGRGLESFESTLFGLGERGPAVSAVLYNLELYNRSTSHVNGENESHLEGPNPHLYLSADGAKSMLEAIAAHMETLDPRYADLYANNMLEASVKLDALNERIGQWTAGITDKRVALLNETLIYPARDFGLDVTAWIDRESGASMYGEELNDCVDEVVGSGARVALIERQAPTALVQALEDAGIVVASIDILSTHRENEGFDVYLDVLSENAATIQAAYVRANLWEEQP